MAVIPALGRQKHEDPKFKVAFNYNETLSQENKTKQYNKLLIMVPLN